MHVCMYVSMYRYDTYALVCTSPVVRIELITSRKPSSFISPSVNKNVIRSPVTEK